MTSYHVASKQITSSGHASKFRSPKDSTRFRFPIHLFHCFNKTQVESLTASPMQKLRPDAESPAKESKRWLPFFVGSAWRHGLGKTKIDRVARHMDECQSMEYLFELASRLGLDLNAWKPILGSWIHLIRF